MNKFSCFYIPIGATEPQYLTFKYKDDIEMLKQLESLIPGLFECFLFPYKGKIITTYSEDLARSKYQNDYTYIKKDSGEVLEIVGPILFGIRDASISDLKEMNYIEYDIVRQFYKERMTKVIKK